MDDYKTYLMTAYCESEDSAQGKDKHIMPRAVVELGVLEAEQAKLTELQIEHDILRDYTSTLESIKKETAADVLRDILENGDLAHEGRTEQRAKDALEREKK